MKTILAAVILLSLSVTAAAADRTVHCELQGDPSAVASILISDQSGQEEMLSINITTPGLSQAMKINGTILETNVVGTSLYNDSQFLHDFIATYLNDFDTVNIMLAKNGTDTSAEILESIADDAAGIIYSESRKNGAFAGGALLAGWAGVYINCTEK